MSYNKHPFVEIKLLLKMISTVIYTFLIIITNSFIQFNIINLSIPQLLHLSLKKAKVTSSEKSSLEMLDPFVLLLLDCLNSMHVKVVGSDVLVVMAT